MTRVSPGKCCIVECIIKKYKILRLLFSPIFYNREEEAKKRKSSAKTTLSTNNGPSADDFYRGGGKRTGMGNIDTRNFLADAFLGQTRSVAPATQYMQVPPSIPQPQQEYYSHEAYYPHESGGRNHVGRDISRSRSRSRRKKRYYTSSSESPSPEPRKRSSKNRNYNTSKSADDRTNQLINID